ncbi:polyubiquitin-tagged protein recognition complex Npl4 component [Artomyces pyxidatus]|uniref:Polyubiquitin-tagged protein recognition complex Npl4 component n=1 Tax=Artomyces pyxidatus TaxID=48021 RepID=A0ACB8THK6_9AGAM|nr:polyubiquitin-tagged protein recognition complex Npl4 component [Artomyces pyxidatus]
MLLGHDIECTVQLVRIRSRDGNFRFEMQPNADISELVAKVLETTVDADPETLAISNQPRGNETLVSTLKGRDLQTLGLRHGDLVFVSYTQRPGPSTSQEPAPPASASRPSGPSSASRPWETVQEDLVDQYWRKMDGKIPRGRDSRFCKHGPNAMCDYCMPLEPYDANYHKEQNIKHLSYHAYLRKISPKTSSAAAAALPPLSEPDYRVKMPCPTGGHPPWPAGICTACQPSAITLQSQPFRMVDHIEIASMDIVDRFLQAWRSTGVQRFGWLIGRYEPYDKVPMGVKAVVEAIHEPPQEGELDGLSLGLPWEDEPRVRALAQSASTPLTIVGYIITDLDPTPEDRSKNVYKRHPGSFFLSSLEVIFAAHLQAQQPTPSRSSPSGHFASRLVTAVLTATEEGQIDISAYQVSEQAVGMVQADMIEASVDPGVMRVKAESRGEDGEAARYVPDVFFRYRNEYGIEVKKSAKPAFPVEYLLVNVTHGFPQNPSPLFHAHAFAIENRPGLEDQKIERVLESLNKLHAPDVHDSRHDTDSHRRLELAKWLSDWHLAAFLGASGLFSEADSKVLVHVASAPSLDDPSVLDPLLATDSWQTLMTFARESAPPARPVQFAPDAASSHLMDEDIPPELFEQAGGGGGTSAGIRICPHCTFENSHGGSDCEVCGLPLA